MTIQLGFTGTRYGMTEAQHTALLDLIDTLLVRPEEQATLPCVAHHGLCVGGDEEFHAAIRPLPGSRIIGHPGPDWPNGRWSARIADCDEVREPEPYMCRNAAIVAASLVMIAAPYEDKPQQWGGTWSTVRMSMRALKRGKLRELYVIGRKGQLLDHEAWQP